MRFRNGLDNSNGKKWGIRRGSNSQQPESQSGALPFNYGHPLIAIYCYAIC